MPNIVPGVRWQPIPVGGRAARRKGRGLCGHVAVSSSKNLVPGPSADWHFYLPKEGQAIQYIDLDLQCWATGAGNSTMAAFESEGGLGTAAQVNAEPWTENQLNWAARILAHMHLTEGVPLRVMASSAAGERGFGTHRLGVPGYMVAGGEQWSSSRGKLCPGDAKHGQRAEVVRRAQLIVNGSPITPTPETDEDDMPKHLRAPNGTIFLLTDDEIVTTADPAQVERWTGLFGPWKNITQAQWDDAVALTERNRPDGKAPKEFLQDLARRIESLSTPDVDEDAIAAKLSAALAGKAGGITAADVKAAVREVLTEGTNAA